MLCRVSDANFIAKSLACELYLLHHILTRSILVQSIKKSGYGSEHLIMLR